MEILEKDIKEQVKERLGRDDRINASQINVEVEGSNVKLMGKAKNIFESNAAEFNAIRAHGVKSVENLITIERSESSAKPDDLEIEANIRNKIIWDSRIDSTETEISVTEGHVDLNGSVYSFWEKQLIEEISLYSRGVVQVKNNLIVNSRHDKNDELLADKVYEALDEASFLNSADINISVNNGLVTLTGSVQSYLAANEAHDALLYIPGVRGVVNNITIG